MTGIFYTSVPHTSHPSLSTVNYQLSPFAPLLFFLTDSSYRRNDRDVYASLSTVNCQLSIITLRYSAFLSTDSSYRRNDMDVYASLSIVNCQFLPLTHFYKKRKREKLPSRIPWRQPRNGSFSLFLLAHQRFNSSSMDVKTTL